MVAHFLEVEGPWLTEMLAAARRASQVAHERPAEGHGKVGSTLWISATGASATGGHWPA
jgi:hypothetical protein